MNFFRVEELPTKEVLTGIHLRSVHLDNLMMTFVEYGEGSSVPTHHHRYEQITYVMEGMLEVTIGAERRGLGAGGGVRRPPTLGHSPPPGGGGAAKALDAWTPAPRLFKVPPLATLGHQVPITGESPQ